MPPSDCWHVGILPLLRSNAMSIISFFLNFYSNFNKLEVGADLHTGKG